MASPGRSSSSASVSSAAISAESLTSSRAFSTGAAIDSKRSQNDALLGNRTKRLRFEPVASTTSPSSARRSSSSTVVPTFSRRHNDSRPASRLSASTSASISTYTTSRSTTICHGTRINSSQGPTATRGTLPRPRTATTYLTVGGTEQSIICAITESRGVSPTVGLACMNLSTMQASLCQIVDSQMYVRTLQKLYTWSPNMILFPSTLTESKIMMFLQAEMPPNVELRDVDKRHFSESDGSGHLQKMALGDEIEPLKVAVDGKFYALCAFSGVVEYLKRDGENDFAPHSLRIKFEPSDGSMMVDLSTIHSLELIQNLHDAKSKDSLFGLINETLTPMGARLLRSWVLQPSVQCDVLSKRYDAIEELTCHENIFVGVRNALKHFVDVDHVLTNIVVLPTKKKLSLWQEQCINYVLILKDFVQRISPLFEVLSRSESELLGQISTACAPDSYTRVVEMIDASINADACYSRRPLELRNQKLYAVKSGTFGLLDVARTAHKETVEDVLTHCSELAATSELSLELTYDNKRGYFMKFPSHELEGKTLDSETFINVFKNKKNIECQTMELMKLNGKLANSYEEIMLMSISAVTELVVAIRTEIGPLFKISDSIAILDVLSGLAEVASNHDYIKPRIASTTAIKAARHPIKIKSTKQKFIPNDVYAPANARLQVLTGCNMSGKSTYIRTVALLQVMAQVGSFVPAEHAEFSVRNQLFARVSTDDNISANVSTFAAEMREAAFILSHVDEDSMVIVDELGRGTSTADGLAIAIAIAEALLNSGALVWFVTHFHDLARFLDKQPGVWNLHLSVDMHRREEQMMMLYQIAEGPVQETSYGISLSRVTCMPTNLLERANQVANAIRRQKAQFSDDSYAGIQARKQKVLLGLRDQLLWAKESSMAGTDLLQWMQALQNEFIVRMDTLNQAEEQLDSGVCTEADTALDEMGSETGASVSGVTEQPTSNYATGPTKSRESGSASLDQLTSNHTIRSTESEESADLTQMVGQQTSERPSSDIAAHTSATLGKISSSHRSSLAARTRSDPAAQESDTSHQTSNAASNSSFFEPVRKRIAVRDNQTHSLSSSTTCQARCEQSSNGSELSLVSMPEDLIQDGISMVGLGAKNNGTRALSHLTCSSSPNLGLNDPVSLTSDPVSRHSANARKRQAPRVLPPVPLFDASDSPSVGQAQAMAGRLSTSRNTSVEDDEGSSFEDLLGGEYPVARMLFGASQAQDKTSRHGSKRTSGIYPVSVSVASALGTREISDETSNPSPQSQIRMSCAKNTRLGSSGGLFVYSSTDEVEGTVDRLCDIEREDNDELHEGDLHDDELYDDGAVLLAEADVDTAESQVYERARGNSGASSAPGSDNSGDRIITRVDADRRYEGVLAKASRSSSIWKIPSS